MNIPPNNDEAAAHADLMQQVVALVAARVQAFAPHLSEEMALQLSLGAHNVQEQVAREIMPTLLNPNIVRDYPTIVVRIQAPNGVAGTVEAPKSLQGVQDPGLAIHWAMVVALLESPIAQATLRAYGFEVSFAQTKKQQSASGLILPT